MNNCSLHIKQNFKKQHIWHEQQIIDPDKPFGTSDAVRILLLQLSSLLVEQASSHIHDANNK
jgi:hypothetical protein